MPLELSKWDLLGWHATLLWPIFARFVQDLIFNSFLVVKITLMFKRSTWLANFSLCLMLNAVQFSNSEGMSRCITCAVVAVCACLCGILTPLEVVYRRYFVQPCELMNIWVSFHPVLRWAGQKLGLSFRAESEWRGRKNRSKIDWAQRGRGERVLGVGDMEVAECADACWHTKMTPYPHPHNSGLWII